LHRYLRMNKCKEVKQAAKNFAAKSTFKNVFVYPVIFAEFLLTVRIVKSTKNTFKNINIGYSFKNWYYIIAGVKLHYNALVKQVYFNINYLFTLIN
jgi:hypothetical protein